jgi:Fur family peroxide stress response transcriptional regulator
MRDPSEEMSRRIDQFTAACREAGLKLTPQRIEIFREVASSAEHPDADAILKGVRERVPSVSLDTVYRTLWFLEDLGLIRTMGQTGGSTRFDANLGSHHHFVCERCGLIRDFDSAEFDALAAPDEARRLGSVSHVRVEVRGLCSACSDDQDGGENEDAKRGK